MYVKALEQTGKKFCMGSCVEAKINKKKKILRYTFEIVKLVNLGNLAMFPLFTCLRINARRQDLT